MSLENTAKSIAAGFAFSGVAWFSDLVSLGISSLQYSVSSALYASVAGPQVLITAAAGFTAWFLARLGGVDLVEYAQALLGIIFGMQAILSLLTLCVFYAFVLGSPKGTYTLSDCLIAAGVFLLEAMPFVCSFTFWGMFAVYLRRRQISGVVERFSQVTGLVKPTSGGGGLSGALKALKK